MTKKAGKKKRIIIILAVVLLALAVPFTVMYHNYTKETCVMEPVERMGQREGVSMDNILVEIEYFIITDGEFRDYALYIFDNGDIYSGYCTQEDMERHRNYYNVNMDNRYWDYVYEPCYWGRLSPCDVDNIINEIAKEDDFDCYHREEYIDDEPISEQTTNAVTQGKSIYDQNSDNIYRGHLYSNRIERDGTVFLGWISRGSDEEIYMYAYDEHAHNAIDIVKSTWAYEQWTNQIFGEGWEERIDLKDELEGVEREREKEGGWHWKQYWEFVWDSILSLLF